MKDKYLIMVAAMASGLASAAVSLTSGNIKLIPWPVEMAKALVPDKLSPTPD